MKNEERRYVIIDKEVEASKKKFLMCDMVMVYDRKRDTELGICKHHTKRIVDGVLEDITYVEFPDGTVEILDVGHGEVVARANKVEDGGFFENFDMLP